MTIDQSILDAIAAFRTPLFTQIFQIITYFGSAPVIIVISLIVTILLFHIREKRMGILFAYLTICDALITFIVKNLTHRLRPDPLEQLIEVTGFSLPSGHSSSSIFLYGAVAIMFMPYAPSRRIKFLLAMLTSVLIMLVGLSRIYLGVHYPTDVLAGYLVGAILLGIFILKKSPKNNP